MCVCVSGCPAGLSSWCLCLCTLSHFTQNPKHTSDFILGLYIKLHKLKTTLQNPNSSGEIKPPVNLTLKCITLWKYIIKLASNWSIMSESNLYFRLQIYLKGHVLKKADMYVTRAFRANICELDETEYFLRIISKQTHVHMT